MSEPKLCPMTFGQGINPVIHPWFQCSQEKCAWWVERRTFPTPPDYPEGGVVPGHCVMLDIGRAK
jgi:hypothetical protein